MKKLLVLLCATALTSSVYAAGTVRDNCGCGLGSMALGDEEGLVSNLAATFLNGICGNQTFGISSGTLGCDQATKLVSNQEIKLFVEGNMDQLAMDIATGDGDYLNALCDMMEVSPDLRPAYHQKLQSNFDNIFSSEDISSEEVVQKIVELI